MNRSELEAVQRPLRDVDRPPVTPIEVGASTMSQIPLAVRNLLIHLETRPEAVADSMEIGICKGATAACRISHMRPGKSFVTVDPFGNIPYMGRNNDGYVQMYTDELERFAMAAICETGLRSGVNIQHWKLTSEDFLRLILPRGFTAHGVWRPYVFSTIFLDGAHEPKPVTNEIRSLTPYLHQDGVIIIDNVDYTEPDGSVLAGHVASTAKEVGLECAFFDAKDEGGWDPVAVLTRDVGLLRGLSA